MNNRSVNLKALPGQMRDTDRFSAAHDLSIGHLVRELLKKEVNRRLDDKCRDGPDTRLIAAIQALLGRDMADASGRADFARRMSRHGYELRPAEGGQTLHKSSCGTLVCRASELGFSYQALIKRSAGKQPDRIPGTLSLIYNSPRDTGVSKEL